MTVEEALAASVIQWYYLQGITSPYKPRDMDTDGCAVLVRQGAYSR